MSEEIKIKLPEDFLRQRRTEQEEAFAHNRKQAFVNTLTLGAVVIYSGLTCWIAIETTSSVTDNRTASYRDLRPYVYANKLDWKGDVFEGATGTASVLNSGRTPAVEVHGCAYIVGLPDGQPMTDTYPCPSPIMPKVANAGERSIFVLGPGVEALRIINSPQTNFSMAGESNDKFKQLVAEGHLRIYFYGDIYYSDMTRPNVPFHTTFCGRFNATTGGLDTCEKHNKMD